MRESELAQGLIQPVDPADAMARVLEKHGLFHENASSDDDPLLAPQAKQPKEVQPDPGTPN